MPDAPGVDPVRTTREKYGDTFNADLLEQYKLYVQSAENISSSRIAASRYLMTINAALLALYGLQSSGPDSGYLALAIPVTRGAGLGARPHDYTIVRQPQQDQIRADPQARRTPARNPVQDRMGRGEEEARQDLQAGHRNGAMVFRACSSPPT